MAVRTLSDIVLRGNSGPPVAVAVTGDATATDDVVVNAARFGASLAQPANAVTITQVKALRVSTSELPQIHPNSDAELGGKPSAPGLTFNHI